MKKTGYFIILSILLSGMVLSACSPAGPAQEDFPPLRVEYTFWWGDYTMLVARELGLFEKYNVAIEPVYYNSYSKALPDLASGMIDCGLFALDDAINTNDSAHLKLVAVYDDGGHSYVVGSPEIATPADLKGQRIGVNIGSINELFVTQTLALGGLTTRDVTLVDISVEDVDKNLGKTIDAGFVWDPYATELLNNGATLLFKSGGTQSITPDVIVFNADVVEQRPADVEAFLSAWFEAVDYRKANSSQANEIIASALGLSVEDLTEDSYNYTLMENHVLFSGQSLGTTDLDQAITANVEFLVQNGVLSKSPNLKEFVDDSFLP